ncbi:MAG: NHLP leader peptide family RiPP precursor [Rikenellaceae bacterium]
MESKEQNKLWAKIVAKAWADEAYKENLTNNTRETLKSEGVEFPEGINLHVVSEPKESTDSDIYLLLPNSFESFIEDKEDRKAAHNCTVYNIPECDWPTGGK